jgi:cystathionine beta-lyase/cystathionine gamma-synthase
MGAVSAAMLGLLEAGDHVLLVNQVYGPTWQFAAQGIPDRLIRISVGLEGADLLIEDLAQALEAAS